MNLRLSAERTCVLVRLHKDDFRGLLWKQNWWSLIGRWSKFRMISSDKGQIYCGAEEVGSPLRRILILPISFRSDAPHLHDSWEQYCRSRETKSCNLVLSVGWWKLERASQMKLEVPNNHFLHLQFQTFRCSDVGLKNKTFLAFWRQYRESKETNILWWFQTFTFSDVGLKNKIFLAFF